MSMSRRAVSVEWCHLLATVLVALVAPRRLVYTRWWRARCIVPEIVTEHVTADFGRRPLLLFKKYPALSQSVSGCWFHCSQVVLKRVNKFGLKEDYQHDDITLFAASWVCHCCLLPTSRLVCKISICATICSGGESTLDLVLCKSWGNSVVAASTSRHWKPQESSMWRWFHNAGKCNTWHWVAFPGCSGGPRSGGSALLVVGSSVLVCVLLCLLNMSGLFGGSPACYRHLVVIFDPA